MEVAFIAQLSVNIQHLIQKESQIKNVARQIGSTESQFVRITNELDGDIRYGSGINQAIGSLKKALEQLEEDTYLLGHLVKSSREAYNEAERQLASQVDNLLEINTRANYRHGASYNNASDNYYGYSDKIIQYDISHLRRLFDKQGQASNNYYPQTRRNPLMVSNTYITANMYRGMAYSPRMSIYDAPTLWDYDYATVLRIQMLINDIGTLDKVKAKKEEPKSFWESCWDGVCDAASSTVDFLGDVASVTGSFVGGIAEGAVDSVTGVVDMVKGTYHAVTHMDETIETIKYMWDNKGDIAKSVWQSFTKTINDELINGDANQRARILGKISFEIIAAVVGTKGLDKLAKGSKVASTTKVVGEVVSEVGEEVVEKVVKEAGKEILEETGEKVAKEVSEKVIKEVADETGDKVTKRVVQEAGEGSARELKEGLLEKGVKKSTSDVSEPLVNGPYIKNGKPNGRPTLTGKKKLEFENKVYKECVDADGILRDPNTKEIIDWKPGEPRKEVVDFGHKTGNSYKDMFKKYKNREITLEELKEFQFNPENYRLETPSANRSHKFE